MAEATDVVLVGGGIMSATLGILLKELEPSWEITIIERLNDVALESSQAFNNAGTGHSALCELNYAPLGADGTVDPTRALGIAEQFHISRQLWASLVEEGKLTDRSFINSVPHMSLVMNADHCAYMHKRFDAFKTQKLFEKMEFSTDRAKIAEWAPLTINGRQESQPVAATYSAEGTDVDFGSLTRQMVQYLTSKGVKLKLNRHVENISREADNAWVIKTVATDNGDNPLTFRSRFVFLGAGGGALSLLQKTGIPEGKGYGGFPVSGLFLRNNDEATAAQHNAKVYGQASVGAPPMSVPHLDTRHVDGKRFLMFGPYAGFKPNFLKQGSLMDLPRSIHLDNLMPILHAGWDNMPLTKYLIGELRKTKEERIASLLEYYPQANPDDWELITAGQRVQVIKKDAKKGGVLQFGTELVTHSDGSLAALLGASPGASTAVPLMLRLMHTCFPERAETWKTRLQELIPGYGIKLNDNTDLAEEIISHTAKVLGIHH
ncbi:malate:quinone oxidoreductase [Neisseria sp. ZJ106]|uniref:Probable malate:quinone oxidoreductase n=1 Tax=Neisseria lisongii TaxID=2912188 RepID=A0AAW5AR91_9NEIS|nr:malate:quinone oxidoreductase [Neisseria lisongii]MCF7520984.1 malate:quinone oxidoreductase [Neisseria lisongii]MCF7529928.1 malate:quinone oxidoreductase [Neisseria lisongii]WCL71214.1 malate:quinone oxidoreductase [Neisseria lisongii]